MTTFTAPNGDKVETNNPGVIAYYQRRGYQPSGQSGEPTSVDEMKLDQLKAYAKDHGIDLDGATKKDEVLAKIKAAEAETGDESDGGGDGEGDSNTPEE